METFMCLSFSKLGTDIYNENLYSDHKWFRFLYGLINYITISVVTYLAIFKDTKKLKQENLEDAEMIINQTQ